MKIPLYILAFCVVAVVSEFSEGDDNSAALPDLALQPPRVTAEFDPDTVKSTRGAQGVPAIERAANGRPGMRDQARGAWRVPEVMSCSPRAATTTPHGPSRCWSGHASVCIPVTLVCGLIRSGGCGSRMSAE
jgi:hypothetical protein